MAISSATLRAVTAELYERSLKGIPGDARAALERAQQAESVTLGREVTPAHVVLCLLDLKLARLAHDPAHEDSVVDVCGYAALLHQILNTTSEGR